MAKPISARSEAFALSTHATKLHHVLSHIRDLIPAKMEVQRSALDILVDMAKNALIDIHRSFPRIEEAPGEWKDKWDIFGYQLALGVNHAANFGYLVIGGIILDGAREDLGQELVEQLTKLRNVVLVIGTEALTENPPLLMRK